MPPSKNAARHSTSDNVCLAQTRITMRSIKTFAADTSICIGMFTGTSRNRRIDGSKCSDRCGERRTHPPIRVGDIIDAGGVGRGGIANLRGLL